MQERYDTKNDNKATALLMWEFISNPLLYVPIPFVVFYIVSHMQLDTAIEKAITIFSMAYLVYFAVQGLIFSFFVKASYKQSRQDHDQ